MRAPMDRYPRDDTQQRRSTSGGRRQQRSDCARFKRRPINSTLTLQGITRSTIVRVMAQLTASVEYGIHCLLWLVVSGDTPRSTRDLAELQGVSQTFLAKIFPKLEKAGIVASTGGVRGGYRLAKAPQRISFLDIVDAIEGDKPLFDCQEIRSRCAVFEGRPPSWAMAGVCAIHAVMLRAEKSMRETLAEETLASVAKTFGRKAPPAFANDIEHWLAARVSTRASSNKPRKRVAPS